MKNKDNSCSFYVGDTVIVKCGGNDPLSQACAMYGGVVGVIRDILYGGIYKITYSINTKTFVAQPHPQQSLLREPDRQETGTDYQERTGYFLEQRLTLRERYNHYDIPLWERPLGTPVFFLIGTETVPVGEKGTIVKATQEDVVIEVDGVQHTVSWHSVYPLTECI